MTTVKHVLLARQGQDPALLFEEGSWTFAQLVEEGRRRVAFFEAIRDPAAPPHIGVLLENTPEYLFWLSAAGLSGSVVVGVNSTYRGEQLAQLITYTDCQIIIASSDMVGLLDGLDLGPATDRVFVVDSESYRSRMDATPAQPEADLPEVSEEDLFLLIFTSGSTGAPKAVRCTQGRFTRTGMHVAGVTDIAPGRDVVYASLPLFHSSSLFTGWASALHAGVPLAIRRRFSASGTLPDIRRFGATVMTYTGKVLNYILAVPEAPDDLDNPLRLAIGNEASQRDIVDTARRLGCEVRDSYGSTEGIIIIRRDASMPTGALGRAADTVKVLDPDTGAECPPAAFDDRGVVINFTEAVGEIVETAPNSVFEGYYRNEEASRARFRGGAYWSGDLAYRDDDGWFYFAGRSSEWLRVDGENFAAAPVEAIISRFPPIRSVAVYAVPDDPVGDRVMAAIEWRHGERVDPAALDEFLADQPDLGPKWVPQFVRFVPELPKLASMKIDKLRLRREAWTADGVWWRPQRNADLVPVTEGDRRSLGHLLR